MIDLFWLTDEQMEQLRPSFTQEPPASRAWMTGRC